MNSKIATYSLRETVPEDLDFLYELFSSAMEPIYEAMGRTKYQLPFENFREMFQSDKGRTKVIQYLGYDVGRIRVVTSFNEIYLSELQILPDFQNLGIGSAVLRDLVQEADRTRKILALEVHAVNVTDDGGDERATTDLHLRPVASALALEDVDAAILFLQRHSVLRRRLFESLCHVRASFVGMRWHPDKGRQHHDVYAQGVVCGN